MTDGLQKQLNVHLGFKIASLICIGEQKQKGNCFTEAISHFRQAKQEAETNFGRTNEHYLKSERLIMHCKLKDPEYKHESTET